MFFHQRFIPGLAIYSYMVGDEKSKQCAVIDPTRDVDEYLEIARREGLRITHVLETHVHADFVSGSAELKARLGDEVQVVVSGMGGRGVDPAVCRPGGRRRRRDRPGQRPAEGDPHPRPHLRARRLGAVRRHPEQGHALADLHRRLPVRRRRGPPRPAGRGGPQDAGPPVVRERLRRAPRACPTSPRSTPPTGPARSAARRSAPAAPPASATSGGSAGAPASGAEPSGWPRSWRGCRSPRPTSAG